MKTDRPLGPALVAGALGGAATVVALVLIAALACGLPFELAFSRFDAQDFTLRCGVLLLAGTPGGALLGAGERASARADPARPLLFACGALAPIAGCGVVLSVATATRGELPAQEILDDLKRALVPLLGIGFAFSAGEVLVGPHPERASAKVRAGLIVSSRAVTALILSVGAFSIAGDRSPVGLAVVALGVVAVAWGASHWLVGDRVERRVLELFEPR